MIWYLSIAETDEDWLILVSNHDVLGSITATQGKNCHIGRRHQSSKAGRTLRVY